MNDELRNLVRLQKIAHQIRELNAQKESGPRRLQELEDQFQATLEDIGAARLRYETLESERRLLETEVVELEAKLEKYHQQLMSVTNAREYSAALNEIDAAKTARDRATEGILVRQAEEEELAEAVQEADVHIAEARTKIDAEREKILGELSDVDSRIETLASDQTDVEKALEPELVSQFRRVFAARGGVAMAPVENLACSACHLRLRPQVYNEVRRGEKLVPCDNCRRFLYVDESGTPPEGPGAGGDGPETEPTEKADTSGTAAEPAAESSPAADAPADEAADTPVVTDAGPSGTETSTVRAS